MKLKKITATLLSIVVAMSGFTAGLVGISVKAAAALASSSQISDAQSRGRLELDFNKNWSFNLGDVFGAQNKNFDDSSWQTVKLPHDFSITQSFTTTGGVEAESGNLLGGTGWYRKKFTIPAELNESRFILNFDGSYNNTNIYVNGTPVAENHYGYNSFSVDITPYITCNGEAWNFIAVKVEAEASSSRWYPGAGIYRDVTLSVVNNVHVVENGVQITDNAVLGSAAANVTVANNSTTAQNVTVSGCFYDAAGKAVGTTSVANAVIPANTDGQIISINPVVSDPTLWSIENPYLYTLRVTVTNGESVEFDRIDTSYGFRTIEWNVNTGFALNGTNVKIKGVNLHHDQGALGAVQEYDAIYRQVKILKDMGCNAIRTSHNIASKTLIEVCDKLGMLVMEEFFDGWDGYKNGNINDFSKYFSAQLGTDNNLLGASSTDTWAKYVMSTAVLRDRNSPSIIIWSLANELNQGFDQSSSTNYRNIVNDLCTWLDELDTTRPVTLGDNTVNSGEPYYYLNSQMDVIGGNYYPASWVNSRDTSKPFVATETASAVSSRGVYDNAYGTYSSVSYGYVDNANKEINSYDTSWVSWGNSATEAWYYSAVNDWFSGEFIWTGFDYIGEPTPWNNVSGTTSTTPNSSYFAPIDTAGFAKDSYYLYRSWWNTADTTLHLVPGTWDSSKLNLTNNAVDVAVYSNAKAIGLYLNGVLIGHAVSTTHQTAAGHTYLTWSETSDSSACSITPFYTGTGNNFYSQFKVTYSAGTLTVKAFADAAMTEEITETNGTTTISSDVTASSCTDIFASVWGDNTALAGNVTYTADSDSYAYIEFEAQDANGNFVNDFNGSITVAVEGNGRIIGVDNGNQATTSKYQQPSVLNSDGTATINLYNGRALAIVRTTELEGNVFVTAVAADERIDVHGTTFTSLEETKDETLDEFEEVIVQYAPPYSASHFDRYDAINAAFATIARPGGSSTEDGDGTYSHYYAGNVPFTVSVPDGDYIITGVSANGASTGALLNTENNSGIETDGSTGTPSNNAFQWTFTKQTSDMYYVSYTSGSTTYYLNISGAGAGISTTAQMLSVTANSSGEVTIGDGGGNYLSYASTPTDTAVSAAAATALNLYVAEPSTASLQAVSSLTAGTQYVIVGSTGGVLTHDFTTGQQPTVDSDKWTVSAAASGSYVRSYITCTVNGTNYFLYRQNNTLTLSTANTRWYYRPNGNIYGNNTNQSIVVSNGRFAVGNSTAARQTFTYYQVVEEAGAVTQWIPDSTEPIIDDGIYIMYNQGYVITATASTTSGRLLHHSATVASDVLSTSENYEYTFTRVSGDTYYITNKSGQYLSIGTSTGTLNFTSTPTALTLTLFDDGNIGIYSGNQFVDHYVNDGLFSTSYGTVASSATASSRIITLFSKNYVGAGAAGLYDAVERGLTYLPGVYDADAYATLLAAMENGVTVLLDANASTADIEAAKTAVTNAIDALKIYVQKFPATLIKYGYSPNATTKYIGSTDFNTQTAAAMQTAILADANLVAQIDQRITAAGLTVTDTYRNTVAAAYARLYTLYFTGAPVRGLTENSGEYSTAWNYWAKANTTAPGESQNEGASIQGLFSLTLDENGYPASHIAYDTAYSYLNDYNGQSSNATVTLSGTRSVTLTPLTGISVYIPDFFSPNNVAGISSTYSKYYWNTEFPFITTTDEYGVNRYEYDSSKTSYIFRAQYDDDSQTAESDIYFVDGWDIERQGKGTGNGFFPFNYQITDTDPADDTLTGESAIYHSGMTFSTQFYVPQNSTHTYANGENILFSFSGDDDVLVYIDGTLILDNGGLHGARSCSIDFTTATITYQYAYNTQTATLLDDGDDDDYSISFSYSAKDADGNYPSYYSQDVITALEKLDSIQKVAGNHDFSFFFLERGSTDSNCKITFNMQKMSEYITLNDQTLVADYGLPIEYNVQSNNTILQLAIDNNALITYLGMYDADEQTPESVFTFEQPTDLNKLSIGGLTYKDKYGTFTLDKDGNTGYIIDDISFTGAEAYYLCAQIANDPTYPTGAIYYAYEKITFIPATTIYYEDNFREGLTGGMVYTDGVSLSGGYASWQTATDDEIAAASKQASDLVGDTNANVYGYDNNYSGFKSFSNASSKLVKVSSDTSTWPTMEFTFTGTGFDVISVTDCTTGLMKVDVYKLTDNADGSVTSTSVKRNLIDTYYGYSYGELYLDTDNKSATLDSTKTGQHLYWNPTGSMWTTPSYYNEEELVTFEKNYYAIGGGYTSTPTYYAVDGGYTLTPVYYDENGSLTLTETESPAYAYSYAYAKSWIKDADSDTDSLYQIPVIKIDLNEYDAEGKITESGYGKYRVVLTPQFTPMFGHYSTDETGVNYYSVYIDAIRIYNPAGTGVDATSSNTFDAEKSQENAEIFDDYKIDTEGYPFYYELRDMILGTEAFGDDSTAAKQGVIFIDGNDSLDNDLGVYEMSGPNNEVYLDSNQVIAFQIWATSVPSDVLIGAKLAKGSPKLSVTYNGETVVKDIATATDMYYSIDDMMAVGNKLKWTFTTVEKLDENGNVVYDENNNAVTENYYISDTVVIANTGAKGNILSLTDVKWTFSVYGGQGYFRIPTKDIESEVVNFMVSPVTVLQAKSVMSALYSQTAVHDEDVSVSDDAVTAGEDVVINVKTSTDVDTLLIKDKNGDVVTPVSIESVSEKIENAEVLKWQVTVSCDETGECVYSIYGVDSFGNVGAKAAEVTVTVSAPETTTNADNNGGNTEDDSNSDEKPTEEVGSAIMEVLKSIKGFFEKIIDFFRQLTAVFR